MAGRAWIDWTGSGQVKKREMNGCFNILYKEVYMGLGCFGGVLLAVFICSSPMYWKKVW